MRQLLQMGGFPDPLGRSWSLTERKGEGEAGAWQTAGALEQSEPSLNLSSDRYQHHAPYVSLRSSACEVQMLSTSAPCDQG